VSESVRISPSSPRHDVIVVGGGVAGLVAARRLLIDGHTVILCEATDRLGGAILRHSVGGIDLDAGAESFSTRGGVVSALATELGLLDAVVNPNTFPGWIQPITGPAFALPGMSLNGIPGSPLASDVIAVIGGRAAARAFLGDALLPGTVGARSRSLAELVRTRMGSAVVDRLVTPVVRGSRSISPADLGADELSPGLRAAMLREGSLARAVRANQIGASLHAESAGIRGGLYRLVEELVADLERFGADIRLNTPVSDVTESSVRAGGQTLRGTVIVAAPGLLGEKAVPSTPLVLATLFIEASELDSAPRGTGVLVARGTPGIRARSLGHRTAKWPWLAERAGGKHVVRLSYDETIREVGGEKALAELARRDASALLGIDLPPAAVLDFAGVQWTQTGRAPATAQATAQASSQLEANSALVVIGEQAAGTGVTATITHALTEVSSLFSGSND
jgi:oxygen-dependent protoporphyrinogen oxidase